MYSAGYYHVSLPWMLFGLLNIILLLHKGALAERELPLVTADLGENITLPCPGAVGEDIVWVRDGRTLGDAVPVADGQLFVTDVSADDEGRYGCLQNNGDDGGDVRYVRLMVRRPPGPLVNVSVRASTVLAELCWRVNDTGPLPLKSIQLRYRPEGEDRWQRPLPPHAAPSERHREVYHLRPNSTYEFQLWPENDMGAGPRVTVVATTLPETSQLDLAGGLMAEAVVLGSEGWMTAVLVSLVLVVLVMAFGACVVIRGRRYVPPNGDCTENLGLVSHLEQPCYELEVIEQDEAADSQHVQLLLGGSVDHPIPI